MHAFLPPAKLGIGFSYQPGLPPAIEAGQNLIDFFEISPDVLSHERVDHDTRVLDYHPTLLAEALRWCANHPIVVHGLGLSIGSTAGWNDGYLRILDDFYAQRAFSWYSAHLAFMLTTDVEGRPLHTGIPLPLPFHRGGPGSDGAPSRGLGVALWDPIFAGEPDVLSAGAPGRRPPRRSRLSR